MNVFALFLIVTVSLLGSEVFDTRQQAEHVLTVLWPLSVETVLNACGHSDPEVRMRVSRIIERFTVPGPWSQENAWWLGTFIQMPYSDSLGPAGRYLGEACRTFKERGVPEGGPLYLQYRFATKLWLEAEGPPDLLLLGLMQVRTIHWDRFGRYP